jgi:hypothetical protein
MPPRLTSSAEWTGARRALSRRQQTGDRARMKQCALRPRTVCGCARAGLTRRAPAARSDLMAKEDVESYGLGRKPGARACQRRRQSHVARCCPHSRVRVGRASSPAPRACSESGRGGAPGGRPGAAQDRRRARPRALPPAQDPTRCAEEAVIAAARKRSCSAQSRACARVRVRVPITAIRLLRLRLPSVYKIVALCSVKAAPIVPKQPACERRAGVCVKLHCIRGQISRWRPQDQQRPAARHPKCPGPQGTARTAVGRTSPVSLTRPARAAPPRAHLGRVDLFALQLEVDLRLGQLELLGQTAQHNG